VPFKNIEDKKIWMRGYNKKYYLNNKAKITNTHKIYRLNNKLLYQKHKALKVYGGELAIETLQQVYEDNIKKNGTLTCYLCLKPIEFGKDSLEHKIPKTKGGTNEKENLAVSCIKCNIRKGSRTEEEFKTLLKKEL
jgi:5-methylcytosine-specific restriction endonuclease McrA